MSRDIRAILRDPVDPGSQSYLRLYNYMDQPIDIQGIDIIDKKKLNKAVANFQTMAGVTVSTRDARDS